MYDEQLLQQPMSLTHSHLLLKPSHVTPPSDKASLTHSFCGYPPSWVSRQKVIITIIGGFLHEQTLNLAITPVD